MGIFRDKVIINKSYNTTNSTTVEKRAPTDESVKLLKEFEEKAESKFVDRIDVKTNLIEYTLLEYAECFDFSGYKYMYYININGKQYKGDVLIGRNCEKGTIRTQLFKKVHESIVSKLVADIVVESFSNLDSNMQGRF